MNTAENITVPSVNMFGLHYLGGKPYVFQDTNPEGFCFQKQQPHSSGYNSRSISGKCPHSMNLYLRGRSVPKQHHKKFQNLVHDPLVKAMLPLPHYAKGGKKVYQLNASSMPLAKLWMTTLEKLSSPIFTQISNIEKINLHYFVNCLKQTNLSPLVISNVDVYRHQMLVRDFLEEAEKHDRTVIFLCENGVVPAIDVLDTQLPELITLNELVMLPLEHLGVRVLDMFISEFEDAKKVS